MKRRTALGAIFAIISQMVADEARLKAQSNATTFNSAIFEPSEELTVTLGGRYGYKRFSFSHGDEKVTITADELFAALKEPTP